MAAVMTSNSTGLQQLSDYLGKGLPPYMEVRLHNHPADGALHMRVDLRLSVHFKGRPNSEYTPLMMTKVVSVTDHDNGPNPQVFKRALEQVQKALAKEIAAGVLDGKQFNRFYFEAGTVQELGRVGKPPKYNPPDPGLSIRPGAIWQVGQRPGVLNTLTPATMQKLSTAIVNQPGVSDSTLQKVMNKALSAISDPPNVINLTFDKDNITLADLRTAITNAKRRNLNTNMIWITPAQRNSLLSDPAFPQYASKVSTIYGHDLEVRS